MMIMTGIESRPNTGSGPFATLNSAYMEPRPMKKQKQMAMKQRTAAWFFREVKRQVNIAPTRPARFDIIWIQKDLVLEKVLDMLDADDAPQRKVRHERWWSLQPARFKSEHLRSNKPFVAPISSWSCCAHEHFDLQRKKQGLWRAVFFGPDYQQPAHLLDVPVRLRGRDSEARYIEVQKQIEAVQRKYGADYHIEYFLADRDMMFKIVNKYGVTVTMHRDKHMAPLNVMRVWRGEEWLVKKTEMFYPAEIAQLLPKIIMKVHHLEPDAEKHRKTVHTLKIWCVAGGRSRRHIASDGNSTTKRYTHTDAEIIAALTDYKYRNPKHKMMTALNNIITSNTLRYSDPKKLLQRMKFIAKPLTPSAYYYRLK